MRNAAVLSTMRHKIYRPRTQGHYPDGTVEDPPSMIPLSDMKRRNCAVIGSMCSSDLFFEVGGFQEYPILEDFALWRAMVAKGAMIQDVDDAVYKIHVADESRNTDLGEHARVYRQIMKDFPL